MKEERVGFLIIAYRIPIDDMFVMKPGTNMAFHRLIDGT